MAGLIWEKAALDEPAAREKITAEIARISSEIGHPCLCHPALGLAIHAGRNNTDFRTRAAIALARWPNMLRERVG
jgi:hypothetical protein